MYTVKNFYLLLREHNGKNLEFSYRENTLTLNSNLNYCAQGTLAKNIEISRLTAMWNILVPAA